MMNNNLEIVKALIKEMNEELKGGQKKLDVAAPFGKITGADFKKLRGMKKEAISDLPQTIEDLPQQEGLYYIGDIVNVDGNPWVNKSEAERALAMAKSEESGVNENHEGTDHEVSMANNSIDSIIWAAGELKKHLQGGERDIPAWIQDHITNAENYILQAAKNYHEYGGEEAPEGEPMPDEMSLQEMIKKVGSKYNVYSKKGKKLGSHPSKKKAKKQMAAIEISKQGK